MSQKPDAKAFLTRLAGSAEAVQAPPDRPAAAAKALKPQEVEVHTSPSPTRTREAAAKVKPRRAELKHFGGYLDDDTLEKIALLRIRLKKDNSELIRFAIEELHRKHNAKRAFGDS